MFAGRYPHVDTSMDQLQYAAQAALHGYRPEVTTEAPQQHALLPSPLQIILISLYRP